MTEQEMYNRALELGWEVEPEWIKHDGSNVCPVSDGHDVEVKFRDGATARESSPTELCWTHCDCSSDIVAHRDWTAYEQQQEIECQSCDTSDRRTYACEQQDEISTENETLRRENAVLRAKLADAVGTLEVYADEELFWWPHKDGHAPAEMDEGRLARTTIARIKGEK